MFSSIHLYIVVHSSVMSYGFLKLVILNQFNVNTEVCIWEEFCKLKFLTHADFVTAVASKDTFN